jgi:hypothetical protein
MQRAFGAALLVVLSIAAPTRAQQLAPAAAPVEADAEYRTAVDDAVREFAAGRFEEARALFKRAHTLSPNARTLRGLGMTAFELRMYVQAIGDLKAALADSRKPLEGDMRMRAEALLDKAQKFVGSVRVELDPATAALLVDGKPPEPDAGGALLLDAGLHVLSATADGHKSTNVRISVEGDVEQTVRMTLEPLPETPLGIAPIDAERLAAGPSEPAPVAATPPRKRAPRGPSATSTWAYGTLIGAGVFGSTAAIFWLMGDGQYDELEASCGMRCTDLEIEDSGVKTSDLLTSVFLGVTAASAVASGVLFIIAAGEGGEEPKAGSAQLRLSPLGASLVGSFE